MFSFFPSIFTNPITYLHSTEDIPPYHLVTFILSFYPLLHVFFSVYDFSR